MATKKELLEAFNYSRKVLGDIESALARCSDHATQDIYEMAHSATERLQVLQNKIYSEELLSGPMREFKMDEG